MLASQNIIERSTLRPLEGKGWITRTMQEQFNLPAFLKWVLAFMIGQWFQIPWVMRALIWLMFIDYGTGLVAAFINRRMSSKIGGRGLFSKALIIVLLLSAELFEKAVNVQLHLGAIGGLAYCANEFISIMENCANAGVPIPKPLVRALLSVKQLRFEPATQEELDALRTDEALAAERGRRDAIK